MTAALDTPRILIVDADPWVRRALADLIATSLDMAVFAVCATTDEAVTACRTGNPRAALVGIRPNDPTAGLAAVATLSRRTPVLVVTPSCIAIGDGTSAGAAACIDEGGDADGLLALLRRIIDGADESPPQGQS